MLNMLTSLLSTVSALIKFVIDGISSLILFIGKIPTFTAYLATLIGYVIPTAILPFITVSISIYLVLFLLGRSNS